MNNLAYNMNARYISNRYRTSLTDKVRVCFYGRVSTQHEAQVNALENQLQWYDTILKDHPNWEKVNVYVDRGVTGTQAKKRPGFMQMIEDASKGLFDLICTREVSRFARNTVDSLDYTRRLMNMGVEVFFHNDNIWSFETDGELRLTIMSAMSQEESKHISDRVLAGQKISREKGVLYGNGNILGYRLVKGKTPSENTYEIVEEEAETVRMIFDLYLQGHGAKSIARKMVERHRKKSSGSYKWEPSCILRIINNKTYAGYHSYNKSYTKSFLEHQRVNIHDTSQYFYAKGNFEPIIPEEMWLRAQALKDTRRNPFNNRRGKVAAKDKWVKCLVCECGGTYKKYVWRTNKNGEESIGYNCRKQAHYGKRKFVEKQGLDGSGYCDTPAIAQWKLEFMVREILKRLWFDRTKTMEELLESIQVNFVAHETNQDVVFLEDKMVRELERLNTRKNNLMDMRLDDMITPEEFERKREALDKRISELKQALAMHQKEEPVKESLDVGDEIQNIKKYLDKVCDLNQKFLSDELVDAVVARVTPTEAGVYKWYLHSKDNDLAMSFDASQYTLYDKFTLTFEEAKAYRKEFGNFARAREWKDLNIEVYVRCDSM